MGSRQACIDRFCLPGCVNWCHFHFSFSFLLFSESLTSSFPICFPLMSLCGLIALARTLITLCIDMQSGLPCVVPDFSWTALSPLRWVWCWLLCCCMLPLLCLVISLYPCSLQDFYHEGVLNSEEGFFSIYCDEHVVFFFQFVYMVDYVNTFSYVEPFLYLWDEDKLVMVDDIFDMFLDSVCQDFTEYFVINILEWDWSVILLNSVFLWFRIRVTIAS